MFYLNYIINTLIIRKIFLKYHTFNFFSFSLKENCLYSKALTVVYRKIFSGLHLSFSQHCYFFLNRSSTVFRFAVQFSCLFSRVIGICHIQTSNVVTKIVIFSRYRIFYLFLLQKVIAGDINVVGYSILIFCIVSYLRKLSRKVYVW